MVTADEQLVCPRCAGPLTCLANGQLRCEYCGWEGPLPAPPPDAALRVETAVTLPFMVSKARAAEVIGKWLKKGWLRPSDLHERAVLERIRAVHLPAARVVVDAESSWSGYDRHTEYEIVHTTETRPSGKPRRVTRQRPREVRYYKSGVHRNRYVYWLPLAGAASHKDLAKLAPWHTDVSLADQRPAAEADEVLEPQWTLEQLGPEIQRLALADERAACSGLVDVLEHVSTVADVVEARYFFLPLWSVMYRYGKKVYPVLVNGQTGEVTGRKPVSWKKVLALVVAAAVVIAVIAIWQSASGR